MAIIFVAVLLFTGLLVDLARIKIAQNQLRRVANVAVRSVMAGYQPGLRDEFRLFAAGGKNEEADFGRYMRANLSGDAVERPGLTLLDFRMEASSLELFHPLGNPNVLKQAILEEMKYIAPVQLTEELVDKFKVVERVAGLFDASNRKRRSLHKINGKIAELDRVNREISTKKEALREVRSARKVVAEDFRTTENDGELSTETKDRRLADLAREKQALEEEIAAVGAEISRQLGKAKSTVTEIEEEFETVRRMEQSSEVQDDQDQDPPESQAEVEQVRASLEAQLREVVGELAGYTRGVNNEIVQSVQALTGDIDVWDLDRVGIDTVESAMRVVEESRQKSIPVNELERDLAAEQQSLARENDVLSTSLAPRAAIRSAGLFEKDTARDDDQVATRLNRVFDGINAARQLLDLRDELYLNEYALANFSYHTRSLGREGYRYANSEVEYILFGDIGIAPLTATISSLYMTRFALDTAAYFAFSKPPVPLDLLGRLIYALIMGGLQASVDTYRLYKGEKVVVAEMRPGNPLDKMNADLMMDYRDHLRLLLLLQNGVEETRLRRMAELIRERGGLDLTEAYTLADGRVTTSIKMWFLPLAGKRNITSGPFGTEIRDGRCYISKSVTYGY